MADLPVTPLADYGSIMMSIPQAQSTIASQAQTRAVQQAQIPQINAATASQQIQNEQQSLQLGFLQHYMQTMNSPAINDSQLGVSNATASAGGQPISPAPTGAEASDGSSPTSTAAATANAAAPADGSQQASDANANSTASSAPADPADGHMSPDEALDSAAIASHVQQKYAVRDIWAPQEQAQLMQAQKAVQMAAMTGNTGLLAGAKQNVDNIVQNHKIRIDNATAQAQLSASNGYDASYALSTAPPGTALKVLAKLKSDGADGETGADAAAKIQALADKNGWTADETDQYVRNYANAAGNALHRWSGRSVDVGTDGVSRDAQTRQPVLGANPVGLSPEQRATLITKWSEPQEITNSDGSKTKVPLWQVGHRFPSLEVAVNTDGKSQQMAAAQGGAAAGATPAAPAPAGKPGAVPVAAGTAAGTAPAGATRPANGAIPGSNAQTTDPVLSAALADKDYRLQTPPVTENRSPSTAQGAQMTQTAEARKQVLADAQSDTKNGAQILQYTNAAKSVMQSGGEITGLGAETRAQVSRALAAMNLTDGDYATSYQEVAKYLGNAALQNAKSIYGARMTQSEVGLQLNELSPSAKMTTKAVNGLLDTTGRAAQYAIDSAKRAPKYLAAGNDPQRFDEWNQAKFDRSAAVNPAATPSTPAVRTAPAAAIAYLKAHPETQAQFKSRFGYLPQ
jgi:hypothetical protein